MVDGMPTKKPGPGDQAVDLETYSDHLDETFGGSFCFAENVVELHQVKRRLAVLETRRSAIFNEVKVHHARGALGNGRWFLHRVETAPTVKQTVPSAVLKKADKKLWERSRVLRPWVGVTPPDKYAPPVEQPLRMPGIPTPYASLSEVIEAYKHPAFEEVAALKRREEELKLDLRVLAGQVGWDGTQLAFIDGWAVSTARLTYDPDVLKRIDPAVYRALVQTVESSGSVRIDVIPRTLAMEKGYLEEGAIEYAD